MTNPFDEQEWKTSGPVGDILPGGDYLVTIDSIDGAGTSSGGHPQIEVQASNDQGQITDWIVVIDTALWRATALFAACELEKPGEGQVKESGTGYRIDPAYLDQCIGKKVGVFVREEPSIKDPTRMRSNVKGWCKAEELPAATDAPADSFVDNEKASVGADDLPF